MNVMLVCIDYTQVGTRTITDLSFRADRNDDTIMNIAEAYKQIHDEVYAVNFVSNSQDFMDEIVKKGCRM